jgi:hypothetical protein
MCDGATIAYNGQCVPIKRRVIGAQCDRDHLSFYGECITIEACNTKTAKMFL